MRRMLVSRSSFEKPSPFDRCMRTSSPSSVSTCTPRREISPASIAAKVDLPAPDKPVNQTTKPRCDIFLESFQKYGDDLGGNRQGARVARILFFKKSLA